jgi:hypothetical protein
MFCCTTTRKRSSRKIAYSSFAAAFLKTKGAPVNTSRSHFQPTAKERATPPRERTPLLAERNPTARDCNPEVAERNPTVRECNPKAGERDPEARVRNPEATEQIP